MRKQALFWEDVQVGDQLPALGKVASTQMLVKWAAASGDFNPLHYEFPFAESQGVGLPIVHGQLKRSWLVHLVSNWIGESGDIRKLSCQFRAVDYPVMMKSLTEPQDDTPTHWCKGKVTGKHEADGQHFVECQIWVENSKGEVTTPGSATVVLPSKAADAG